MTVTKVTALPDDVLLVEGTDAAGDPVQATGWQSAMSNYYPPKAYDGDGNLVDGAAPRAMTAREQQAYWAALLDEAAPQPAAEPVILFES